MIAFPRLNRDSGFRRTNAFHRQIAVHDRKLYDPTNKKRQSGRSSRMLKGLKVVRIFLIVALASTAVASAQNSQPATQRGKSATAGKAFDPHDLSGFWDITNTRGALNATSNNRPPMTPWGLEKFHKTRTGDASALSNGSSRNEKEWNDPIRWCDPTGFPRIIWSPTPAGMRFAQTGEEVLQFFENNRV